MDNFNAQGPNHYEGTVPPRPDNYLVWAILATVFCCLPFGIVAIVYASKVNTLYDAREYEAAMRASNDAKKWCIISVIPVIAILLFYLAVLAIAAIFGCMASVGC